MVAGCNFGGSVTDLAANMGLIQNLLSQDTESFHLLLVDQDFLLPALIIQGLLEKHYLVTFQHVNWTEILNVSKLHFPLRQMNYPFDYDGTEVTWTDLKGILHID